MKTKPLEIIASDMKPNGNILTQDPFLFLEEIFKTNPLVLLADNGFYYTVDSINELANDIAAILEKK